MAVELDFRRRRSVWLGIASAVFYGLFLFFFFLESTHRLSALGANRTVFAPLQFISLFLAGLLGVFAARNGNKWWFVVPAFVVVTVTAGLILVSMAD